MLLCRAGDKSKVAIPLEHPPKNDGKNHAERGAERPFGRLFCHRFLGRSMGMAMLLLSPAQHTVSSKPTGECACVMM